MMSYRSKKDIHLSSFDNLTISIFVIGYRNIGESIVVLFRDKSVNDDKVVLSMVIDSYGQEQLNLTRDILKKYSVEKVDFICWTHPHTDHSPGIDTLVKDMMHDGLVIFSPKFHYGNIRPDLLKTESAKTKDIFDNIWSEIEKHKDNPNLWRTISADGDVTHGYPMRLISDDNLGGKELAFFFLTPLGRRTDYYSIKGNMLGNPNELSVSFFMTVDGYNFYFGGDTEKEHAEGIETEIIKGFRWIKVPHHCSLGGKPIADRLGPMLDYAASTVYSPSKLPVKEIQDIYASSCLALHMTQLEEVGDYKAQHDYGIIQYDYKFGNEDIVVSVYTYGNAGQYFLAERPVSNNVDRPIIDGPNEEPIEF